ncbi:MAG: hypothetical protein V4735_06535 [Pseudomonadota bacterium]
MRKPIFLFAAALAVVLAWYGIWSGIMAADVARVRTSIEFQNQRLKANNRQMTLKSDGVSAVGFPFHFRVGVTRATLSMISGNETYAVSIPQLTLEPLSSDEGRYRVVLPPVVDAMYAVDGAPPESYIVTISPVPAVQLRAQGDSNTCSPFPGSARCPAVAADAPLISYAPQVPSSLTLDMQLNGETRTASFTMTPLNVPMFAPIPANMTHPLELFIGVLREALVFKTK